MNFTCLYTFVIYLNSRRAWEILKLSIESCFKDAQNDAFGLFVTKTSAEKLKKQKQEVFFYTPFSHEQIE
jgi:hypothetical protein